MSIPSEARDRAPAGRGAARPRPAILVTVLTLLIAGLAASILAPASPLCAQTTGAAADSAGLRRTLDRLYEVLPVKNGVLLRPRAERLGVRSIEVSGDMVAVNGERVSAAVLRAWLGEEQADPILSLSRLDPPARRALFGLPPESGAPPTAAGTPAPPPPAERPRALPGGEAGAAGSAEPAEPTEEGEAAEAPAPPVPPVPPAPPSVTTGPRVRVAGGVTVQSGEVAEDVTAIGGPVRVKGEVIGDALAVGGSVWIDGRVGGGVTAVGGSVHLGPKAEVMGDVTSVWGRVDKAPGAKIHGSTDEVTGLSGNHGGIHFDPDIGIGLWPFFGAARLFSTLLGIIVLGLLVCLVMLIGRPILERLEARLAAEPWKAAGVGLAALFSFGPLLLVVTILLIITIVGCLLLLLYPFLFLGVGVVILVGYSAAAYRVGRWSEGRFGWRFGSPYVVALVGVGFLEALRVVGRLLSLGSGVLDVFAAMFLLAGFVVRHSAWICGVGAILLELEGVRRYRRTPALPAAPAIPATPAVPPPDPFGPSEPPR